MIRILATALLALCLTASSSFATSLVELVEHDGIFYKKFTDEPFTGKLDEGALWGVLKNGKREGPWLMDYANGQLSWKGAFKSGKREGPWVAYWANGKIRFKGAYRNGKREGPWVGYNSDGTKYKVLSGTFRNGKKSSD